MVVLEHSSFMYNRLQYKFLVKINQLHLFLRAMVSGKLPKENLLHLLRVAGERHQKLYRDAMNGKGIDRHLFALYVVSKGLGYVSCFVFASQTVHTAISNVIKIEVKYIVFVRFMILIINIYLKIIYTCNVHHRKVSSLSLLSEDLGHYQHPSSLSNRFRQILLT